MASLPRNAKTEDEEYQNLLELSQNQAKLIEEQAARLQAYEEAYEGIEIPGSSAFGIEPRQLDRFTATFPGLPTLEQPLDPHRPLRICIITPDIVGPVRNGGIGTAYRYAADLLTSAGHQVTILYILGNHSENGPVEEWVKYYADRGVTFVPMPRPEIETGFGDNGRAVRFAYGAYCWLKSQEPFDLVHLTEWRGGGYFCMLAKRLGLAFQDTLFCVKCSSPSLWNRAGGSTHIDTHIELGISFMERRSVELGDVVVSGSLHLLRWMLQHGYRLNRERCHVQPNIMLGPVSPTETSNSPKTRNAHQPNDHSTSRLDRKKFPIDEIVFFGRLEPRKGIFIFCDALSRLVAQDQVPRKVVFLGKVPTNFPARDIINERAKSWPFEVEIVSHLSQLEVVDFLKQGNRLAVIASLLENSSFAIYECLLHRIPFILCRSGGSPELVDKEDHAQVLFDPHPGDLQKLLGQVLRDGALLPQPSFDNDRNNQTWLDWHAWLSQPGQIQKMSNAYPAPTDPKDPLVSVCIAHFNRPELVRQAIESVKRQSYRNFEVVLVDDGSPGEENAQFLDQLE
ncbi:MAG: glycosyltransferase, partial [Pseudomonadota bacterium]